MFYTIEELVQQADHDYQGNIAELMIATEIELSGRDRSEILKLMTRNLEVICPGWFISRKITDRLNRW